MKKKSYHTPMVHIARFDVADCILLNASSVQTAWDKVSEELQKDRYNDYAVFDVQWGE